MRFLPLVIIFWSLQSLADMRVERSEGKVYLAGSSCDKLATAATVIAAWNSTQYDASKYPCQCQSSCRINLDYLAPEVLKNYSGMCASNSGPNCWNTALYSAHVSNSVIATTGIEMSFWLHSPLCKERGENEAPQPGDVVAIRDKDGKEKHAFVYLNNEIAFNKMDASNGKEGTYGLETLKKIYARYPVDKNCRGIHGNPSFMKFCGNYSNYFHCTPLNDYLKKHPLPIQLKKTWDELEKASCFLSDYLFDRSHEYDRLALTKTSVTIISELAKSKLKTLNPLDKEYLYWGAILLKTESVLIQIDNIQGGG